MTAALRRSAVLLVVLIAGYGLIMLTIELLGGGANFHVCNFEAEVSFTAKAHEKSENCCDITNWCPWASGRRPLISGAYCTLKKSPVNCDGVKNAGNLNFMLGSHTLLLQPDIEKIDLEGKKTASYVAASSQARRSLIGRLSSTKKPMSLVARPGYALDDSAVTAGESPQTMVWMRYDQDNRKFEPISGERAIAVIGDKKTVI